MTAMQSAFTRVRSETSPGRMSDADRSELEGIENDFAGKLDKLRVEVEGLRKKFNQ